jgi:NADPH-dependent 2,4-dienoyl-CoA reductase/sulfur reductase-like enzyme
MPSVPEPGGPSMRHVVVVGASLAGLRTAEALRQAGFGGRLTVVGDETHPPYNRPPLTKAALVNGPDAAALSLPSPVDLDARWVLGVRASALDLDRREVGLGDGELLPFDGLVIATGASARRLTREIGDTGVHHIRTLGDAAALHRALARPNLRVLVIGAGFLGCEVASTAASLGHRVTLVEAASGPMLGALGPELSAYCAGLHRRRGVDLRTTSTVRALSSAEGGPGTVAVLEHHPDGDTSLVEADVVVAALGATPNTEWLRGSGLDIEHGVATDDALTALDTTGAPVTGVVAVGDVARVPQPLLDGAAARVEHWATAVGHSRIAATTLLGGEQPAAAVLPSFWTDQHGLQIRGLGLSGAADTTTVVDGAMANDRFVVTRTRRGRLVGAVAVNNTPALFRYRSELEEASRTPQPTR